MKIVLYTQRVDIIESYGERRDCADQRIPEFLNVCGYTGIPLPNVCEGLSALVGKLNPSGIVLTGGNSLKEYGGNAEERDRTDRTLIKIALEQDIPLYGFCRGMQSILDYFDVHLEKVDGHVAKRHIVEGVWGRRDVNSYHNQAAVILKPPLCILAASKEGIIEAVSHETKKIIGTMWHPERENPFNLEDIQRVKELFG